ncbi:hypothetical protein J3F84DRAFT_349355 [Trichoderma pleuroticola]
MAASLTVKQIETVFENIVDPFRANGESIDEVLKTIEAYADPNIVFHVVGQEFSLGCHVTGFQAMKNFVVGQMAPAFLGALDTSKDRQQKIVQVISGGEGNSVIQFEGKGVSKTGKPWVHESLLVLKTNNEGKFVKVTAFMDTLHLQNHFLESTQ